MINLHRRNQQGVSLIETLITLLIIAVGVVALIQFQHNLVYADDLAKQQADATLLASNKLNSLSDLNLTSYATIASGTSTSTTSNTSYTLTWTVTPTTTPAYKNMSIVVAWTDRNGTSQSVTLVSNVANLSSTSEAGIM